MLTLKLLGLHYVLALVLALTNMRTLNPTLPKSRRHKVMHNSPRRPRKDMAGNTKPVQSSKDSRPKSKVRPVEIGTIRFSDGSMFRCYAEGTYGQLGTALIRSKFFVVDIHERTLLQGRRKRVQSSETRYKAVVFI